MYNTAGLLVIQIKKKKKNSLQYPPVAVGWTEF